jgi:hypothetical protein
MGLELALARIVKGELEAQGVPVDASPKSGIACAVLQAVFDEVGIVKKPRHYIETLILADIEAGAAMAALARWDDDGGAGRRRAG